MKLPLVALALLITAPAFAHEPDVAKARRIDFPALPDGRHVLAVDLHTHSVFSDGMVWPSIRVQEAQKDGLYAMAVTEHLEYQPKITDIPHPDRNRSYALATEAARPRPLRARDPEKDLLVINGAEVTRGMPPGHINAVFITDANALITPDATDALRRANDQGAFVFWNHPYWTAQTPDGVAKLTPMHQTLIKDGLLHGVEVANGADLSPEAFKIAIDNNLTILGTSDIHGLIDWEYDLANGGHRTATLVLTPDLTADGLKSALKAGDTVAIYNDNLVGLKRNVEAVVKGVLTAEVGQPVNNTQVTPVRFTNSSPVDMILENVGATGFYDEGRVFTVKAHSSFDLLARNSPNPAAITLKLRVMNAQIGPSELLELTYGPALPLLPQTSAAN
ncbi:PHP domain-containing protein [bacterium]|nr:PHP domain-containing protein [bacterium]